MQKRNPRRSRVRSSAVWLMAAATASAAAGCQVRDEPPPEEKVSGWQVGWADGAVFYEVFVRSFADSNGDGIGDMRGLTSRLDYLNDGDPTTDDDLGVEGLWLMPVFVSPSYHGYDTTDYENINPDYGSNEDFRQFLEAAHGRGIRVVLDLMINHTGRDHPWFVDSASSPDSARRGWYVWRDDNPGWKQPWGDQQWPTWHEKNDAWYYGIFWAGMPDLNFRNPEVRAEVTRIARLWLDRGVDGFRLDAARHIAADGPGELQNDTPDSHAFWKEFAREVRSSHPQALLVGENWTSTDRIAPYYGSTDRLQRGDELPMNFNFPLAEAIITAVTEGDAGSVAVTLHAMAEHYPPGVLDGTFLTNHDMVRLATQLDSDRARLRSAAAILLTLPGTPFLYYGEEIGAVNGPLEEGDPAKRTPMAWDVSAGGGFTSGTPWSALAPDRETANVAVQKADPDSLLTLYRRLIRLRSESPALRNGTLRSLVSRDEPSPVLAFIRESGDDRRLVLHNLSGTAVTAGPYGPGLEPGAILFASDADVTVAEEGSVSLPAGASAVLALR